MTPLLAAAVAALAIALVVVRVRAQKRQQGLEEQNRKLTERRDELDRQLASLAKYQVVADAVAEAARITEEAGQQARRLLDEAEERESAAARTASERLADADRSAGARLADAERRASERLADVDRRVREAQEGVQQEVGRLRADAAQVLREARERADGIVRSAAAEAQRTIDTATKRAEEIAGSAFEAVQNAERYEKIAKAMKNVVEGYGDQYIVPSHSLLDELAAEYGFAEAGQELKNAREQSRRMVKNGESATCDYVEANRRETAIRFVVDAFNGKVDSILSRVKETNAGTLAQEIHDAFTLVNANGAAFRNARVLESYLEARLAELRWAATVQELRARDREEQRRIRERIREEEKAQREFQRALKETAKEDPTLTATVTYPQATRLATRWESM